jgi:hypothetical protein
MTRWWGNRSSASSARPSGSSSDARARLPHRPITLRSPRSIRPPIRSQSAPAVTSAHSRAAPDKPGRFQLVSHDDESKPGDNTSRRRKQRQP